MVKTNITENSRSTQMESGAIIAIGVNPKGMGNAEFTIAGTAEDEDMLVATAVCAASLIRAIGDTRYPECMLYKKKFIRALEAAMESMPDDMFGRKESVPERKQDVVHWN